MSILQRIPWVSLTLLLLSYSTLGWVISETKAPLFVWAITVLAILLFVGSLTVPWTNLARVSSTVFKSSTRTFVFSVFAAFLFFVMLAWFRMFLDTLLIIAAAILARIDFQAAGVKEGKAFWLTSLLSLAGVALGAAMQMLFVRHVLIR
ncbi:hypothetical protein NIES37_13860 [Tolypothrix tenuis PCC 7101]|uniref:Uncharacterized protein n=1 Tax=Tolypothrix tenuis PCC 7101 TaxID=231146 RepID=A0A1Z4MVH0_9CYAN|nr:hypothetical protein [Aulosira sp. FACHB-113]BAY97444.1 hypothetical protein NIES37_13860 [Tolypothrix tenuis PCC 7101]BAZ72047.1 hypothetical protein NIES50_05960 [Aulosira laxa NIES-50]